MANFLQRFVAVLLAVALFAGLLVVASIVVAVATGVALGVAGWLWWRNRRLRRGGGREAVVIEGEYRVEDDGRRLTR